METKTFLPACKHAISTLKFAILVQRLLRLTIGFEWKYTTNPKMAPIQSGKNRSLGKYVF